MFATVLLLVFFVPFKVPEGNKTKIVYDTIWSEKIDIDTIRLCVYFLSVSVIYIVIFQLLKSLSQLEEVQYKKIARRELKYFVLFVFINSIVFLFLLAHNFINELRLRQIENNANELESMILKNEKKFDNRRFYWDYLDERYDLSRFDHKIGKLWDYTLVRCEEDKWLDSIILRSNRSLSYSGHPDVDSIFSKESLRRFIKSNVLTKVDFVNLEGNKKLKLDKESILEERKNYINYDDDFIRKVIVHTLLWSFLLLYVFRLFVMFVLGIRREVG